MTVIDETAQCARCRLVGVKGQTCTRGCGRLGDAPGMPPDVTVDALAIAHAQIERLAAGIEEARRHYREQLAALEIERNEAIQALGTLRLECSEAVGVLNEALVKANARLTLWGPRAKGLAAGIKEALKVLGHDGR